MAEALANLWLGGYEELFVNDVDEDLLCLICHSPLREPLLTKCGHRFCNQCLEEHITRQEDGGQNVCCPVDRTKLIKKTDVFPDKATERKVLSLIIKCPSEGCKWTGELRSKHDHLASCPKTAISCPYAQLGCGTKVQRGEVESHLQSAMRLHLDLACVKLTELESKRFDLYTWKITGFSEVLRKAKSGEQTRIESFPFTLGGHCGYRFKIYLHPNGIESGKNTHLSFGMIILRGEYDAILSWPLDLNFTITLIDQQENPNDRKNMVDHISPEIGKFRRPGTCEGESFNIHRYLSHNELWERRYILDDTLFIQVKMEKPQC